MLNVFSTAFKTIIQFLGALSIVIDSVEDVAKMGKLTTGTALQEMTLENEEKLRQLRASIAKASVED
jgi:hypothetical protein